MKKLVLFFIVAVILGAYTRNVSVAGKMESEVDMKNSIMAMPVTPDGFFMKDGKMMMNDGKFTMMVWNVTFSTGQW